MNFSKYISRMNDRHRIKGRIFKALGLGNAYVIYQKALSRVAWKSFVASCVRGLLRFLRLEYGRKNGLRERGGASKLFLFFFLRILLLLLPPSRRPLNDCSSVVSNFLRLSL